MTKTLSQLFRESAGPTVEYKGLTVHGVVFRQVTKRGRFVVRFIKAIPTPVQALLIDIDPGKLVIENTESPKMILRLDTSPDVIEVCYRPSHRGSRITIYNGWINEEGGVDAWMVHAGMLVEEAGNKMMLRCSDGRGKPTFDDLVVEIEFLDNYSA
jgi:hypothetical protein